MFRRAKRREHGQAIVLMAVAIIVLLAFAALAIDGGVVLSKRRITQNAADASALGGIQYVAAADSPSETALLSRIHDLVESHGVPDTDGTPGNEVNDNVTIFYTDQDGNQLGGCSELPCGSIPLPARGLDVIVRQEFPTFIAGVLGIDRANVAATAVAVIRGGSSGGMGDLALLALADDQSCLLDDKPIDFSGQNSEILGATHTNSYIYIGAQDTDFHGQLSYIGGWNEGDYDPSDNVVFEPDPPAWPTELDDPLENPFESYNVSDFAWGESAVVGVPANEHFDLSYVDGKVTKSELMAHDPQLYDDVTKELKTGIYYAGDKEIELSDSGMHGTVTLISSKNINVSGSDIILNAYLTSGLLMYSDHQPLDPCKELAIYMGGSSGGPVPDVKHISTCPYTRYDPDIPCWTPSAFVLTGLVYAPRGKVHLDGSKITFIGSIAAWTIELSGSNQLVVNNPFLFPSTTPVIELIE